MYDSTKEIKKTPSKIQAYIKKNPDIVAHIATYQLDTEEIISLVEGEMGERTSIDTISDEKKMLIETAKNTIRMTQKKQQITVRLPQCDITKLKSKAAQQGIPYQTLLSSIVHQRVTH